MPKETAVRERRWWCWRCKSQVQTNGLASAVYCPKGHLMKEQVVAIPMEVVT